MKMTTQHFEYLEYKLHHAQNNFKHSLQEYLDVGMTKERLGWDLIQLSGLTPWMCKELYPYLNDAHIETALRKIIH